MGSFRIPYYVVKKGRYGYWQPTKAMRDQGFAAVRCGKDGPEAWQIAAEWNERWQRYRRGLDPQAAAKWPKGSIGEGFERFKRTDVWATKKPRTREDWERGFARIAPVFGDIPPTSHEVTLESLSRLRSAIERSVSLREAHRVIKIWRALWNVLAAMQYCGTKSDPSLGIRNRAPEGRKLRWSEGQAARLAKQAWRMGYPGLATAIAIAWDTQFSPVDVRQITPKVISGTGDKRVLDIGRAKSGRDAIGTLSRRTLLLLDAYLAKEPCEVGAILRNRSGTPYSRFTLPDDFAVVREKLFPGDRRTLADMRRSGAMELLAGGASANVTSAKMANTIDTSSSLQKTYQPVDLAAVRAADEHRRIGRRRLRDAGE